MRRLFLFGILDSDGRLSNIQYLAETMKDMPWAEIAIFPAPFAASGVVWFFWGLPAVLWTWGALAVFFSLVVAVPLFLDLFRRRK